MEDAKAYVLPLDELVRPLRSDLKRGLSQKEAEERLGTFGPNVIPKAKSNLFRIYIAPLLNWLVNIYLIISTILAFFAFFILPDVWGQVAFWFLWIAVNAIVAIVQQAGAQKKLEALEHISPIKSKVIRDGGLTEILSEQIVPGDIIKLGQGDRVPADARIITASCLRVNEAALTGESDEIEKFESSTPIEKNTPISGRKNMVFLGTYVAAGTAQALVLETGSKTQLGRISENLRQLDTAEVPLRKKVNKIAKYLALAVLIYLVVSLSYHMVSLYLSGGLFIQGSLNVRLVAEAAVRSLITSMSIMPINIPLLSTVILVAGALAMTRHQVVIRNLSAVESLGRVSVICSDKTGTITKNEMTVKWVCLPGVKRQDLLYSVTGVGFEPDGKIVAVEPTSKLEEIVQKEPLRGNGDVVVINPETSLEYLLVSGMLNNESTVTPDKPDRAVNKEGKVVYSAIGDTTDAAILTLFRKSKLDEGTYKSRFQGIRSYPFDSTMKRMTAVFRDNGNGKYIAFTKGATEILLPRCRRIAGDKISEGDTLDEKARTLINQKANFFASYGHRVISFAFRYLDELPPKGETERNLIENSLTYLGFVAIIDPPRDGVFESVAEAKSAGIRPVMITGDSLETAKNVARQVGIIGENDRAVEAYGIEHLSDEEFLKTSAFARVSPEDKMAIVVRYKKQNRAVVTTGDGVNDAPAIAMADVGIAMGVTGTDVAKQAADMVIADDSFNSLVVGIREGRGIFQKIRSVIFFYIAANFAEALIYFGASLIPGFFLLNTWQKIYIFTTVHSIPPLALIIDRLSKDVMKEKPRDTEDIFNRHMVVALVLFSISLAIVFYAVYFGTLHGIIPVFQGNQAGYIPNFIPGGFNVLSWSEAKARTMLLTVAIIGEILLVISLRRLNKPVLRSFKEDSYWVIWPFLLLVPLVHLILMYFPEIQLILAQSLTVNLEIIRLTWVDWIIAIVFASVPTALLELYKIWVRKQGAFF